MSRDSARTCPACTGGGGRPWGTRNGYPFITCGECATRYCAASIDAETLHDVYSDYYGTANLEPPDFVRVRLSEIVSTFAGYRTHGRLLDVGFGAGLLLDAAAGEGWRPTGIEVSQAAVTSAARRGYEVFCGTLREAAFPDGAFDVVTLVEVLEHLTDPSAVLTDISRVLRPGGLLWATTPHGQGVSARVLGTAWSVVSPPEHIQLFSRSGIRRLLKRSGFVHPRLAVQGVNAVELVTHLRGGNVAADQRVATSYQLNEYLMSSPVRRVAKSFANRTLSAVGLGDSLKIYAERG